MLFTVFILLLLTALVATDDPEARDEADLALVHASLPPSSDGVLHFRAAHESHR